MGPRSYDRGELEDAERRVVASAPFNGAAVLRPRREVVDIVDDALNRPSMGPRSYDRGETRHARTVRGALRSFNGAAVLRPRRADRVEGKPRHNSCPSMGPRSYDRGETPRLVGPARAPPAFNGAAVLRPRRGWSSADCSTPSPRLQWGRGLTTAESDRKGCARRQARPFNGAAVLRPRRAGLGCAQCARTARPFNGAAVLRPRRASLVRLKKGIPHPLQWGRGLTTAESRRWSRQHAHMAPFNGAAVLRPRRGSSSRISRWRVASFNGAAVLRPRRDRYRPSIVVVIVAFNGAAVLRPRRGRCRLMTPTHSVNLQWGRGLTTAESANLPHVFAHATDLQWGRGLTTAESWLARPSVGSPSPFNGAAVLRPRRVQRRHDFVKKHALPSMGPRSYDRGEVKVTRFVHEPDHPSMGPRSYDRGESVHPNTFQSAELCGAWREVFNSTGDRCMGSPPSI